MGLTKLIIGSKDEDGLSYIYKTCILAIGRGSKLSTYSHANALQLSQHEAKCIAKCFIQNEFVNFWKMVSLLKAYYHVVKNEDDKIVCAIGKECGKLVMLSSKTAIAIVHSTGIFLRYVGTSSNIVKYLES